MDAVGWILLVGTDKQRIINEVSLLIENKEHYLTMSKANNPYGEGKACERIIDVFN